MTVYDPLPSVMILPALTAPALAGLIIATNIATINIAVTMDTVIPFKFISSSVLFIVRFYHTPRAYTGCYNLYTIHNSIAHIHGAYMENTILLNAIPTSTRLVMVVILSFCVDFPFFYLHLHSRSYTYYRSSSNSVVRIDNTSLHTA